MVNPHRNVGAQIGYRRVDSYYAVEDDSGSLNFKGLYFGATLRF
jgi:hypothetical protein